MKPGSPFGLAEQLLFARLSGDFNPIHLDAVLARRAFHGRIVVHGVHLVLRGLDFWLSRRRCRRSLRALTSDFLVPVSLGEEVTCRVVSEAEGKASIELLARGRIAVRMRVTAAPGGWTDVDPLPKAGRSRQAPKVLTPESIRGEDGRLDLWLDSGLALRLFPGVSRFLPQVQLAELLAATRLVGMECPGLHSVLSKMDLRFDAEAGGRKGLSYRVVSYDERFSLAAMEVSAPGMQGVVEAFMPPPPQKQVLFDDIRGVEPSEFRGQRALVIGGSRGLGEVTAKLLAAGGSCVKLTHFQGVADAHRVVDDIVSGGGRAETFRFDVLDPGEGLSRRFGKGWVPTHVYYFASPPIFVAAQSRFSSSIFKDFTDYYVIGFLNSVNAVRSLGAREVRFFYPSSAAIDGLPLDMGEYAAAKMAGEILCSFLEKSLSGVRISVARLPRLATDQTRSLISEGSQDPAVVILKELRRLRDL